MSDSTNNKVNGHIMSLQQLISAPLVATIDADAMSTERYMKHFMSLAFESYNPADGSTGALRLISFNFTDSDASGGTEKKVSVPLISLVTLPLLQIKQADFDFDINIIDAVASAPDERFSLDKGEVDSSAGKVQDGGLNFRASLAPQAGRGPSSSSSLQANMKIHVTMHQADMPSGLSQFLQLTSRPHYEDSPSQEK
ncbi:DUF2589 domain-containing protein [uncultured Akkermansia sp.]|uniref:DUF2589 domain-containing protein n=1 Tax=uncultured Akkermansia sp. TaxID=512294 RepID=UPI00265CB1A0|nr:DUF2589 domain-containing protein [uncultured Akkermansia sp.]